MIANEPPPKKKIFLNFSFNLVDNILKLFPSSIKNHAVKMLNFHIQICEHWSWTDPVSLPSSPTISSLCSNHIPGVRAKEEKERRGNSEEGRTRKGGELVAVICSGAGGRDGGMD